jgi:hypothetical protein
MNEYTFHVYTERVSPPYNKVHVKASTKKRAWEIIEANFPLKGIRLGAINNVPYVEESEPDTYCPPDPEEKYWSAVATWNERFSY